MIYIFFYSIVVFALLFFCGIGPALLFLPKQLKHSTLWLTPWIGVCVISVFGVALSMAKIPMNVASFIILVFSTISLVYAYAIEKQRITIHKKETIIYLVLTSIVYGFHIAPLLKIGFPTVLTLGNIDPISYVQVADYLVTHTVWQGSIIEPFSPKFWPIGDLLHYSYRWGSPIVLSFFSSLLKVQSYKLFTLVLTALFSLTIPALSLFTTFIAKRKSWVITIGIVLTYAFNPTILYMLYHVFFAQFVFTGIYILLLFVLFERFTDIHTFSIKRSDVLIAIVVSSITTVYPEGLIFVIIPITGYLGLTLLHKKSIKSIILTIKIAILTAVINPFTFKTAILQNLKIIFSTSQNSFIGWETIRHASPIEILGFYNLYHYRPLSHFILFLLSIPVLYLFLKGFFRIKNKIMIGSFLLVFFVVLFYFVYINDNFFLFHRTILYALFLYSALFSLGLDIVTRKQKKAIMFVIILCISLVTVRSFRRTWNQFYIHHQYVDKKLVSLQTIPSEFSDKIIYLSDAFFGDYDLWQRVWSEYFLNDKSIISPVNLVTEKDAMRLPDYTFVLSAKNKLNHGEISISYTDILWENEYYVLGYAEITTGKLER